MQCTLNLLILTNNFLFLCRYTTLLHHQITILTEGMLGKICQLRGHGKGTSFKSFFLMISLYYVYHTKKQAFRILAAPIQIQKHMKKLSVSSHSYSLTQRYKRYGESPNGDCPLLVYNCGICDINDTGSSLPARHNFDT